MNMYILILTSVKYINIYISYIAYVLIYNEFISMHLFSECNINILASVGHNQTIPVSHGSRSLLSYEKH